MSTDTGSSDSTSIPSEIGNLRIRLSNFKDEIRDITDLVYGFSIYEDLFRPTCSLEMLIIDAEGLIETFPIIGDEHVTITYKTRGIKEKNNKGGAALDLATGETGELYTTRVRSIQIYKLSKKLEIEERQHSYILNGVDDHQILNEMLDLNQSYVGQNCIKAIQSIFTSSFIKNTDDTFRPFNIQQKLYGLGTNDPIESTNSSFYIAPGVTPFESITHLKDESEHVDTTKFNNSDYVFYQDYEGFHITTLSELKSQPAKYNYTVKDMASEMNNDDADKKATEDSGDEYTAVLKFEIHKNFDTVNHLSLGTYGNRVAAIDLLTKRFDEKSFSYNSEFNNLNPMGPGRLHSRDSLYRFSGSTHTRYLPTELLSSGIPYGSSQSFQNELSSYSQHPYFYPIAKENADEMLDKTEGTISNEDAAKRKDSIVKNDPKIANPRRKHYLLNKRVAGKGILDTILIDIIVPGNSDIKVGDTLNFYVPQTSRDAMKYNIFFGGKDPENNKVTPKFLVVKVNQKYVSEVSSYHTIMTIAKDSYALQPEAALALAKEESGIDDEETR